MKRTTLSLIAGATALAAVTGFAALTAPDGTAAPEAKTTTRLPVECAGLVCPVPSTSEVAETLYTSYTPTGTGTGAGSAAGKAEPPTALLRTAAGAPPSGGTGTVRQVRRSADSRPRPPSRPPAAR
ncbi:hypothetical protein STANM309S_00853 [Streptomyces tanashiensis]